jgi:hypothetical protein
MEVVNISANCESQVLQIKITNLKQTSMKNIKKKNVIT